MSMITNIKKQRWDAHTNERTKQPTWMGDVHTNEQTNLKGGHTYERTNERTNIFLSSTDGRKEGRKAALYIYRLRLYPDIAYRITLYYQQIISSYELICHSKYLRSRNQ